MGTFKTIVWLINVLIGIGLTLFLIKKVCNDTYNPVFLYYAALPHQILESFGIFIGVLLLMYTLSADWLDIFNKTHNDLYRSHKNVISNTIQWSIVYFGALLYYRGHNNSNESRKF